MKGKAFARKMAAARAAAAAARTEPAPRRRRANPQLLILHNPTPSTRALEAYRTFHEVDPKRVAQVDAPYPELIALGDLVEIVYRPTRGARRGPAFVHKFGRGAVLAATPDGKSLCLIPGRRPFVVDWERGIVG